LVVELRFPLNYIFIPHDWRRGINATSPHHFEEIAASCRFHKDGKEVVVLLLVVLTTPEFLILAKLIKGWHLVVELDFVTDVPVYTLNNFGSSGNSVGKFRGLIDRKAAPVLGFRHFVGGWDLA
jgi:hypothetical protein